MSFQKARRSNRGLAPGGLRVGAPALSAAPQAERLGSGGPTHAHACLCTRMCTHTSTRGSANPSAKTPAGLWEGTFPGRSSPQFYAGFITGLCLTSNLTRTVGGGPGLVSTQERPGAWTDDAKHPILTCQMPPGFCGGCSGPSGRQRSPRGASSAAQRGRGWAGVCPCVLF